MEALPFDYADEQRWPHPLLQRRMEFLMTVHAEMDELRRDFGPMGREIVHLSFELEHRGVPLMPDKPKKEKKGMAVYEVP